MPTLELADATIHYKVWGQGPPVLGIMGFGLDQRFWASQIAAIMAHGSFVTFDNRGMGRSQGEPATTIEGMAADALALLDHLDLERVIALGASMGGAIGQRLALEHPDRVAGLVLAVTWARPLEFMRRQHEIARMIVEARGPRALVDASIVRMFTPQFFEAGAETIDRMVAAFYAPEGPGLPRPEALMAQLDAIDKHDALAELARIRCPALVLGAKMDVMAPYFASEEIAAAVPGAELATFETGHACMIEEMQAVNERISEFLAGLERW
jgi:aminoacrylate hydrolase